MRWFIEGLPSGQSIPWGAWVIPMFWWLSFFGAVYFIQFCIGVILRKQWVEHERLSFPLLTIPREMVRESESRSLFPAFMKSRLFWIGFAIPFSMQLWGMASRLFPLLVFVKR